MSKLEQITSRKDIGSYLNSVGLLGEGVEIGVEYGGNAHQILSSWKGSKLHLVDPYIKWPDEEYCDMANHANWDLAWQAANNTLSQFSGRTNWLRMTSDEAVSHFADESLDFIYIDGNHHNPQFQRDLDNWFPKVRKGGLFSGHDFYDMDMPTYRCEVKSTVSKFCADRGIEIHHTPECTSWFTIK